MESSDSQLTGVLAKNFASLSPQLQNAARFVMDHPEDVATYSLRQIAKRSGLTPPTFSRLARAIGYDEFESLKDQCRHELRSKARSLAERANALQKDAFNELQGRRGSFAESQALSSVENINTLLRNLNTEDLADVADKLASAKTVLLAGALSSRAILEYFFQMVNLAKSGWKIVSSDTYSTASELVAADENAMVIVLSIAPYMSSTVAFARLASEKGACVVAITDDVASPVLQYTSHPFFVPTESPQFFPSYIGVLTLLEILSGMLVRRWGEDANQRIDSVEKMRHAVGDYFK